MQRSLLWLTALSFLIWEAIGAFQWVRHARGFGPAFAHLWETLHSDWMLLVVVSDHLVIALCVLVWLWRDATERGWSRARRLAWVVMVVVLGSPALLVYLAVRPQNDRIAARAA